MSAPRCNCGATAVRRTSRTPKNPNRDFFACAKQRCKLFTWCDQAGVTAVRREEFTLQLSLTSSDTRFVSLFASSDASWLVVEFKYDRDVVSIVKQLHPSDRSWVPADRHWLVKLSTVESLLQMVCDDDAVSSCLPSSNFGALVKRSRTAAAAAAQAAAAAAQAAAAQAAASSSQQYVPAAEPAPRPALSAEARKRLSKSFVREGRCCEICPGKMIGNWQVAQSHEAGGGHQKNLDKWIDLHPAEAASRGGEPAKSASAERKQPRSHEASAPPPKRQAPASMECGVCERRRDGRGEHVCRLFGRFECRCGSAWTSAYVWRYSERAHPYCEKQGCRKCGAESEPVEWRPRAKEGGLGSNINGAHDASRCGRCRKLGYNCSGFFGR